MDVYVKSKTVFVCKECGNESSKWMGKCPGCGTWNSMIEEKIEKTSSGASKVKVRSKPVPIAEISTQEGERTGSGSEELDRVLGGGIVKGSLVLCGGEPGIGKSTLLLQLYNVQLYDNLNFQDILLPRNLQYLF